MVSAHSLDALMVTIAGINKENMADKSKNIQLVIISKQLSAITQLLYLLVQKDMPKNDVFGGGGWDFDIKKVIDEARTLSKQLED